MSEMEKGTWLTKHLLSPSRYNRSVFFSENCLHLYSSITAIHFYSYH